MKLFDVTLLANGNPDEHYHAYKSAKYVETPDGYELTECYILQTTSMDDYIVFPRLFDLIHYVYQIMCDYDYNELPF